MPILNGAKYTSAVKKNITILLIPTFNCWMLKWNKWWRGRRRWPWGLHFINYLWLTKQLRKFHECKIVSKTLRAPKFSTFCLTLFSTSRVTFLSTSDVNQMQFAKHFLYYLQAWKMLKRFTHNDSLSIFFFLQARQLQTYAKKVQLLH